MNGDLSYFHTDKRQVPELRQRCLRALAVVASCWSFLGAVLVSGPGLFGIHQPLAFRLHLIGLCALMVAGGIYSITITFNSILRERPSDSN